MLSACWVAELAGGVLPSDRIIDGWSFASQIRGNKGQPREWIYNQFEGNAWIRYHRWKLYTDGRLYDMTSDPLEQVPILPEEDDRDSDAIRQKFEQELETLRSRSDR